ncbi:hypothetical protein RhiirA1_448714 [Rhizophagus irregularis]|uniref:MATA-HMG n=1 Tax=Rhizophagus irregularis TaxID=588596 RepID=A0A2N1P3Z3_9GLOM|nr:hypothetical protein RhiirA1_448714 [Rhizophagus irregularis]PKK80858.1 hypothetical protein RhiirC2_767616 [Rhizophagus irregularis]CAB4386049.1 unnamed protein product [Rhizophagus irregularis]CAB4486441.1 unnamed protein product [Rhizophagus irregularis]CAB5374087.1 unnamed protein product [Rhizophagus irregularis]
MDNIQCFYNFKNDTSEKQIIVLRPNFKFLIWKLGTNNKPIIPRRNKSSKLACWRPIRLFKEDYLEAMCKSRKKPFKLDKIKAEIAKAWYNADVDVRIKYIGLIYFLNSIYNLRINCLMDFHLPQPTILNHDLTFFFKYNGVIASRNILNQFTNFPKNLIYKNSTKKVTITLKKSKSNKSGCYIRIHFEK